VTTAATARIGYYMAAVQLLQQQGYDIIDPSATAARARSSLARLRAF
jgi:hypothetical protein